jgi:hypothetical protein
MALPKIAKDYGLPSDAHVAMSGAGQILYRVLAGAQPGVKDFRSDREKNRAPAPNEPWIEHAGLSMFDTGEVALAIVSRFPAFVAELEIPLGKLCSVAKTGPPRHFTVWGEPNTLLSSVVRVFRQNYASATLEVHL